MVNKNKNNLAFNLISLLVANLITLFLFIHSEGSVRQAILIYFIQALLAAFFYYKRISKIRLVELDYYKVHFQKKAGAFEKEVHHQIPNDKFMFLLICILPLVFAGILLLGISSSASSKPWPGGFSISAIILNSVIFLLHYLLEYKQDYILAAEGKAQKNRYTTGKRAFLSLVPLFGVLIFGSVTYQYFGSVAMFAVFICLKTSLDAALSLKGISI